MAQFHVYRNLRSSSEQIPYLLDVQSNTVEIATRIVVPLVRKADFGARLPRINLELAVAGEKFVASVADLAALPLRELRQQVADCSALRAEILAALDFMFTGY